MCILTHTRTPAHTHTYTHVKETSYWADHKMAAITFREPKILVETVTKLVIEYLHVPDQVSSTLAGKKNCLSYDWCPFNHVTISHSTTVYHQMTDSQASKITQMTIEHAATGVTQNAIALLSLPHEPFTQSSMEFLNSVCGSLQTGRSHSTQDFPIQTWQNTMSSTKSVSRQIWTDKMFLNRGSVSLNVNNE